MSARMNALIAVEHDPVRRRERVGDMRLAAAVALCPRVEVAEALLLGAGVPAQRLDPALRHALDLEGIVELDEELAVRVAGYGPIGAP